MLITVTKQEQVDISMQCIVTCLKEKLNIKDFKIINGELYEYQRTNWRDYDYVKCILPQKRCDDIIEQITALNTIINGLNARRNIYTEQEII